MKSKITIIFSLLAILSCTNSSSTIKNSASDKTQVANIDSTESVALQHLFDKINTLPNASFKGNEILINDTSIRLKINVEFDRAKEDKWIYAADITTFYKAGIETEINVVSVGIGSNRADAINICLQEWFAAFGIPFTNLLNDVKSVNVSDLKVFSGLMGIRGNLPENTWLKGDDKMTRRIMAQIEPLIKNTAGDIIPIDIKLMIGKNGITHGECRINNQVSAPLLDDLKQLSWPLAAEEFMFKQFYLVKKYAQ